MARRKDIIGEDVVLISLQNGMDNEKIFLDIMPSNPIMGGYTCHGVIHDLPGHIIHSGEGFTVIGSFENISPERVTEFGECLESIGITPTVKDNIRKWIFKKVITNAAINPLTAILDIPNGELLKHAETEELMKQVVAEGVGIAKEMDMDINAITVLEMVKDVARRTRENISSMLQDIRKGNRTEIDCINGSIVKLAREFGREAPVNETLTRLVKLKQGRG
jgi:2-dehydropantoate 2-reductase